MKVLIINNLASGYREGSIYDFMRSFVEDGDEVCLRFRTKGLPSTASRRCDSFDVVVASGGDGTIASVAYRLRNNRSPLLPYPAGTANLLSLNLLGPNEPHALAKLARSGKVLEFDMGEIGFDSKKRGFMIMAGAGYDAAIMESAAPNKKLFGPLRISSRPEPISHRSIRPSCSPSIARPSRRKVWVRCWSISLRFSSAFP